MKRSSSILILAAALAIPFTAANAGDLSYSYLEAGYLRVDPDGAGKDDTFGIAGSGAITENFNVVADYSRLSEGGFDANSYSVGLGYHTPINDTVDFVTQLSYDKVSGDFDGHGYTVKGGVRASFTPNFEGGASLVYSDFEDDNSTSLEIEGQYKFNSTWGISTAANVGNDGYTFFIGPRVSF
jgi:Ax21 family sulfation-dependent quorum factor